MKMLVRLTLLSILTATCLGVALADKPGNHPHYLHSLSDLRHARGLLNHLAANEHRDELESNAIAKIDAAINTIKAASIDDGKNLNDHPPVDAQMDRRGRFHRALELLDKAHNDIAREEDDPSVRGLRDRALHHIDEAHRIVDHLIVQNNY